MTVCFCWLSPCLTLQFASPLYVPVYTHRHVRIGRQISEVTTSEVPISIANISGNDGDILKSDQYVIDRNTSCVRRKKSGKLWFSNYRHPKVKSYPPKSTFSEDHVSAPGVLWPQIFIRVRQWSSLACQRTSATNFRTPYNFLQQAWTGAKIGLNFSKCTAITWGQKE